MRQPFGAARVGWSHDFLTGPNISFSLHFLYADMGSQVRFSRALLTHADA